MSVIAIDGHGPLGIAAASRLRSGLRELLVSWADVPHSAPPPHDPVTADTDRLLACETRRRACSTFD